MHRHALVAAFATACYAPSPQPGAPCGSGGACPSGQTCRLGVCVGAGTPDDASDSQDAPVDAPVDAPIDAAPLGPWGTPLELTTLESSAANETDPSVSADKLTVVLSADIAPNDGDLYIATRTTLGNTFTGLTPLSALNAATFNERSPELSSDGKTLFFTSNRSGTYQVYVSTYTAAWSAPTVRTDLSVGTTGDLAISPDGLTAAVVRNGAPNRIWIHTRATTADLFDAGVLHAELNVTTDIAAPSITNSAAIIYLHAGPSRDIYRATRDAGGTFTTPAPVTELNTANVRDAAPFVVQTDNYAIFERSGNIFEATR